MCFYEKKAYKNRPLSIQWEHINNVIIIIINRKPRISFDDMCSCLVYSYIHRHIFPILTKCERYNTKINR